MESASEMELASESQTEDKSDNDIPESSTSQTKWDRARIDWLLDSDAETSKAWLTALMCGYGIVTFL